MSEPRAINPNFKTDVVYHEFTCAQCGEEDRNTYCEPHRTNMLERRLCYHCNYWRDFAEKIAREHREMTIIKGHVYSPGDRTSGSFRGMAGRRFDIEYIEPSVYAGQRITTFDLWSGSTLPEDLHAKYPDTAVFLGGAERVSVGDTGCWSPSDTKTEPYPLPKTLKPKSEAKS